MSALLSTPVSAPPIIKRKVEQFLARSSEYTSAAYRETPVRIDFVDPMFEALGWDMSNREGAPEAFREVVHEPSLRIGGISKAPDYSFRIGRERRFFVEAKKPAVKIGAAKAPAYQLRRYGWNAGLDVSVLTDFEEFAVYDCRVEPKPEDDPQVARLLFINVNELVDRWDEIAELFARDRVAEGALAVFADARSKAGAGDVVDARFLRQLEVWRMMLASDVTARNRRLGLSREDLSYVVQATLDRIIFLRICEDRGLEQPEALLETASSSQHYVRLVELFRQADLRYNSGLFHFSKEADRSSAPDTLTPSIEIGDEVLESIIGDLYYPKSPFEFSVMGPDILGRAYEQFLGSEIVFRGSTVAIEPKPEVRKAGGVYYTPQFVVEYIVDSTLDPMLAGKTVAQISDLTVVDPACGSGSFLVTAYQYLLDWHLEHYLGLPKQSRYRRQRLRRGESGEFRLTLRERRRILITHVFGVDIDPQAVEVAKLSLLLKAIEGETQMELAVERLLPDLGSNIVCGNSLIDVDYHTSESSRGVDPEVDDQLRPFSWRSTFPRIFDRGGFDAVIGNPPYLNVDDVWGRGDPRLAYLKEHYDSVYRDKTDLLFYFLAKALDISRSEVSFIVSRAFLEAYKADKLRGHLAANSTVRELTDLRNAYVFDGVGITTAIVHLTVARNRKRKALVRRLRPSELPAGADRSVFRDTSIFDSIAVEHNRFGDGSWLFAESDVDALLKRIDDAGQPIGEILEIGQGMQTGRNNVFGKRSADEIDAWGVPDSMSYERARNSQIRQFAIEKKGEFLLYTEPASRFSGLPIGVQDHLQAHSTELQGRAAHRRGDCEWWRYTWPLHKEHIERDKLLSPYMAAENRFAIDTERRFLGLTDTVVLYDADQPEDLRYILGLLNSRVLTFRYRYIGKLKSGGLLEYFWNGISRLPIPRLEPTDPKHIQMVDLVSQRIEVAKEQLERMTPARAVQLDTRAKALDAQIEDLVRRLYGLDESDAEVIDRTLLGTG